MVQTLPLLDEGCDVPRLCLCAFRGSSAEVTKERVRQFYSAGGRHFEVAELFGNAHTVCEALGELKASRSELYITLKVWPKSRKLDDIVTSCTGLLHEVGLEYVDLLMIHAPIDVENKSDQWKALEDLRDLGIAKSLGAVNLSSAGLTDLLKNCRIMPAVLEMEVTPFNQMCELTEFCSDSNMVVLVNEPLSKGIRAKHPVLQELAAELGGLPVELLLLRYAASKGHVVGVPVACLELLRDGAEAAVLEPLPEHVVRRLDRLDEGLGTAWVPREPTPLELEELGL